MTVLLHIIMHSYLSLIPAMLLLVQRPSRHFTKIGVKITTGYVHVQELYLKLSDILKHCYASGTLIVLHCPSGLF